MEKKLLSISIAAYNVGNLLSETLDSLIVEEHLMNYLDIMIVNDGSTDNTLQVAQKYKNKYPDSIRVFNKQNEGFGSTINYGIENAVGKYFMLLDGDDWINTVEIHDFLQVLDQCVADLVITPYQALYMQSGEKKIIDCHTYIPTNVVSVTDIPKYHEMQLHEMIVRTSLLQNNKIHVANCFYTDNELALKILLFTNTIIRYPQVLYRYRLEREGQSVSLIGARKHYQSKVVVADHMQESFLEHYRYINSKAILKMLEAKVGIMTADVYYSYMVQERPEKYKDEVREYDNNLKKNRKYIYDLSGQIKKVRLIRSLNFQFYKLICKIVLHKAKKNEKY